ncbi:SRPBCC family protein [Micromonospora sp. WMMD1102]|uniref:SRPBCC family protein n=1 Tax=Micromonospora sp. WMMD1102 TaxID=3016105 RepID=UPI0024153670|nr:SRPBCC family protein [Micromonospora sp. WMMD1102]MDG4788625.1 SRPBCC family protein [Micromonospora sp. WMMD1102]
MKIRTEALVNAGPDVLWKVLSQPTRWPALTESIVAVELLDGSLRVGDRVRIVQPRLRPMVWTVTEWTAGSSFAWTASAGGVTTVGTHVISPVGSGETSRLVLGLEQTGVLAPLIGLLAGGRIRRYVEWETAGLKAGAEAIAGSGELPRREHGPGGGMVHLDDER